MSKQIDALKLALEALEHEAETGNDDAYRRERDVIREALADSALERMAENERELGLDYMETEQPAQQQEPVAYSYTSRITGAQGFSHHPMPRFIDSESWDINPLYTCPPASKPWVGLTPAEAGALWKVGMTPHEFSCAIEAKLREKNA